MANIDQSHVQDMAKLMAAMNAAGGNLSFEASPAPTPVAEGVIPRAVVSTPESETMGKIMAAFSRATDEVVHNTSSYPELKKALVTEATLTGSRMGSWEIAARQTDGTGKFYDVAHAVTGDAIASDLRLYEAALALVSALNDGETINSLRIKNILNVEEEYSRALTDAVQFSARMKVTEGTQRDVAEARYSNAKQRAMTAKKSLGALSKLF